MSEFDLSGAQVVEWLGVTDTDVDVGIAAGEIEDLVGELFKSLRDSPEFGEKA